LLLPLRLPRDACSFIASSCRDCRLGRRHSDRSRNQLCPGGARATNAIDRAEAHPSRWTFVGGYEVLSDAFRAQSQWPARPRIAARRHPEHRL
jgi:hypothetical protein